MIGSNLAPEVVLARMIGFIIGVTIHEFAHAWSAYRLGDPTAARMGRITLNPIMHFDPIGFIGLMLISLGWPAFGWGKPVPVNPNLLQGHRKGMAITAAAGPLSNVIIATLLIFPLRFGGLEVEGFAYTLVTQMIFVNLLMASFNMIPIPPLDGLKILTGILPNFWYQYMVPMERYGFAILLIIILLPTGRGIIGSMYAPVFNLLRTAIVGDTFL
jgi:Zn-dependent protease